MASLFKVFVILFSKKYITMNNQIVYSIIEASYAIYMFNYFETKLTNQHPLKQFENCIVSIGDFLRHPTERSEFVENKICPIGHIVGFGVWTVGIQ